MGCCTGFGSYQAIPSLTEAETNALAQNYNSLGAPTPRAMDIGAAAAQPNALVMAAAAALETVIKQQRDRIAELEAALHEAGVTFADPSPEPAPKHAPFPARALRFGWAR